MIAFRSFVDIKCSPEVVFDFLANVDRVQQAEGSPVLALERTTTGPPGVGSRYREVVRMLPFLKGEILSEYTAFDPPRVLEMAWTGPGMAGRDRYELEEIEGGTRLVHHKDTSARGLLRVVEPMMRRALLPRLEARLQAIKGLLEGG
jgi:Polyketide cyclase / dehydrase and lipid transport